MKKKEKPKFNTEEVSGEASPLCYLQATSNCTTPKPYLHPQTQHELSHGAASRLAAACSFPDVLSSYTKVYVVIYDSG